MLRMAGPLRLPIIVPRTLGYFEFPVCPSGQPDISGALPAFSKRLAYPKNGDTAVSVKSERSAASLPKRKREVQGFATTTKAA